MRMNATKHQCDISAAAEDSSLTDRTLMVVEALCSLVVVRVITVHVVTVVVEITGQQCNVM